MLVCERMSHPVLTISQNLPIQDALARMRKEKVRRYPVIDEQGKMIGIVTYSDLLNASPSSATSLSVWEINYLISKITVKEVMTKNVITIHENCPIEEAARLMADAKIGGLPVVDHDKLVGIITETDLFNVFIEMLGARHEGIRLTVDILDKPGKLHMLSGAISSVGGNIRGLGIIQGENTEIHRVTVKVSGVDLQTLQKAVEPAVEKIIDIQQMLTS